MHAMCVVTALRSWPGCPLLRHAWASPRTETVSSISPAPPPVRGFFLGHGKGLHCLSTLANTGAAISCLELAVKSWGDDPTYLGCSPFSHSDLGAAFILHGHATTPPPALWLLPAQSLAHENLPPGVHNNALLLETDLRCIRSCAVPLFQAVMAPTAPVLPIVFAARHARHRDLGGFRGATSVLPGIRNSQ